MNQPGNEAASGKSLDGLRFHVLGPLAVRAGDRWLRLGGPGQRSLLAALLLRANHVVSSDRLIEAIWGQTPPRTAAAKLQAHVSALRHALGNPFDPTEMRPLLVTRPPGYSIIVEPEQLDLNAFEVLAEEGLRLTREEPAEAAAKLRAALSLWHGLPLDGIVLGGAFEFEITRLEERHFGVVEERIDADLALGRHAELIAELEELARLHPLRERVHGQLMLALYRSGRRAEALDAFQRARGVLVEELGLEPGHDLQRLERGILTADPGLSAPPARPPQGPSAAVPSPFPVSQLPAAIDNLVGRDEVLGRLHGVLTGVPPRTTSAPVVAIISGLAGVGKTALAVRAAHEVGSWFPDGQLYVSLHEAGRPIDAGTLLMGLLRALGVDGAAIPDGRTERSQLLRSRVTGRRILVVLDDVASEAQVRPLLPGSPTCAVLMTSRVRLDGIEGAHRVDLGLLTRDQAIELIAGVAGHERVGSDTGAAAAIVESCGRLPLALRIVGAKLAARPYWPLARLATRLADDRRRLDELMVGDLDVRACLTLSYSTLPSQERRAFRLAGLLPMPDFTSWMVAALLEVDAATAERLLEGLANASLVDGSAVDAAGQTRYSLHGLLRTLALERAHGEEPAAALATAERRVIAACTAMARRAEAAVPGMRGLGRALAEEPRPGTDAAETEPGDPLEWFAAERPGIVAAVARACALGLDELACALAAAVSPYLSMRSHHEDWRRAQELATEAARAAGNRHSEAYARCWLGYCHLDRGDPLGAEEQFGRSRALFIELGDPRGEAHSLHGLGTALHGRGRVADGLRWLERGLRLFQELGDRQGQAWSLFNLGACQLERAETSAAVASLKRSIELFGEVGDPLGRAYAVRCLGNAHQRLEHLPEAVACLLDAFRVFADLGDQQGQAIAVLNLGGVYRKMGRVDAAMTCLQSSLGAFTELGSRFRVGTTLYELGQLHEDQGRADEAAECYRRGLREFREVGVRVWEARTLRKVGDVLAASDAEAAGGYWSEALAISRELGE
jgi:DNA-binding SARP family transcriptional activator